MVISRIFGDDLIVTRSWFSQLCTVCQNLFLQKAWRGRISESCTSSRRKASGFGVPHSGGASWATASLASHLPAELQTELLKPGPISATFRGAPA